MGTKRKLVNDSPRGNEKIVASKGLTKTEKKNSSEIGKERLFRGHMLLSLRGPSVR